jgi:fused signal recognition particle receptor
MNFFKKLFTKEKKEELDQGLEKTKTSFFDKISKAIAGRSEVDTEVLDEIEAALISSDIGLDTAIKIIDRLEARVSREKYTREEEVYDLLKEEIIGLLTENHSEDITDFEAPTDHRPYVIMVVGVNGVGKTTTIGKLAHQFMQRDHKVLLGAADTFRAAAVDQLGIWADRTGAQFYSKGMNTDPAAVAYESVQTGIREGCDVVIIDTAGRLHTKINLMNELGKIHRSIGKALPGAPHDVLLVLDATTGQNAMEQCKQFMAATDVQSLALTKLDGTAKGGVALGISDQFKIPIKYIGLGERMDQLQVFNRRAFVEAMFSR